jgi:hypothetical protein
VVLLAWQLPGPGTYHLMSRAMDGCWRNEAHAIDVTVSADGIK